MIKISILISAIRKIFRYMKEYIEKHRMRKDLISFLKQILRSNSNDMFTILNSGILISYEKDIGTYRFSKLFRPLKEMKICNIVKGHNGNIIVSVFSNTNYSKIDIKNIMVDLKKGKFDEYL